MSAISLRALTGLSISLSCNNPAVDLLQDFSIRIENVNDDGTAAAKMMLALQTDPHTKTFQITLLPTMPRGKEQIHSVFGDTHQTSAHDNDHLMHESFDPSNQKKWLDHISPGIQIPHDPYNDVFGFDFYAMEEWLTNASREAEIPGSYGPPFSTDSSLGGSPSTDAQEAIGSASPECTDSGGLTLNMDNAPKDDSLRKYPCTYPGCTKRMLREYTREVHMRTHIVKPTLELRCREPGCRHTFSRPHDRLRHEVGKHNHLSEWSCQRCSKHFASSRTFGNHKCNKVDKDKR